MCHNRWGHRHCAKNVALIAFVINFIGIGLCKVRPETYDADDFLHRTLGERSDLFHELADSALLVDNTIAKSIRGFYSITDGYPSTCKLVLSLKRNLTLTIRLRQNNNVSNRFVGYYIEQGQRKPYISQNADNCYYEGDVENFAESFAAVNLCNGTLSGLLRLTMVDAPIILTHYAGSRLWLSSYFGADTLTRSEIYGKKRLKRAVQYPNYYKDYIDWPIRYVELVLVVDSTLYKQRGSSKAALYSRCKEIVNIMNSLYRPLNIQIALVGVEIWMDSDQVSVMTNSNLTLTNFMYYRRKQLNLVLPNDNAQLLTGVIFAEGVVGKALKGPMCSFANSGGVAMDHSDSVIAVATTVAHEIGHNFGMEHDSDECDCPQKKCIMAPASGGFFAPTAWSACSVERLAWAMHHGSDYCLLNQPATLFESPTCGNGFQEKGEECDCGLPNLCDNPCCNATTCKLQENAQCATGECCDRKTCLLKAASTQCRAASGECDLPEYCDGRVETCPLDVFKENGIACKKNQAYCYDGGCKTRDDQCQLIWGDSGRSSESLCYSRLNIKATVHGNCGYDKITDTYTACAPKDVQCGLLHCRHENERPEFGDQSVVVSAQTFIDSTADGSYVVCRSVQVDLGMSRPDPGLVPNGTMCGASMMCANQRCLPVEEVRQQVRKNYPDACPDDCGDHGVCNSVGQCHCDPGYGGEACTMPGFGGSRHSNSAGLQANNELAIIIGCLIFLLLIIPLLTAAVTLLYKRRDHFRKYQNTLPFALLFPKRDYGRPPGSFSAPPKRYPSIKQEKLTGLEISPPVPPTPTPYSTLKRNVPVSAVPPMVKGRDFVSAVEHAWNNAAATDRFDHDGEIVVKKSAETTLKRHSTARTSSERPKAPPPSRPDRPTEESLMQVSAYADVAALRCQMGSSPPLVAAISPLRRAPEPPATARQDEPIVSVKSRKKLFEGGSSVADLPDDKTMQSRDANEQAGLSSAVDLPKRKTESSPTERRGAAKSDLRVNVKPSENVVTSVPNDDGKSMTSSTGPKSPRPDMAPPPPPPKPLTKTAKVDDIDAAEEQYYDVISVMGDSCSAPSESNERDKDSIYSDMLTYVSNKPMVTDQPPKAKKGPLPPLPSKPPKAATDSTPKGSGSVSHLAARFDQKSGQVKSSVLK